MCAVWRPGVEAWLCGGLLCGCCVEDCCGFRVVWLCDLPRAAVWGAVNVRLCDGVVCGGLLPAVEAFGGLLCAGLLCGVLRGGWRVVWRANVLCTVWRPAVFRHISHS